MTCSVKVLYTSGTTTSCPDASFTNTPALISEVQGKLAARGFACGPADGTLNEKTKQALMSFPQANNRAAGG